MSDYRAMFDREYIGAWDLPPGRDVTLTIARVVAGKLTAQGGRTAKKPIVYFEGKEKGFVLNKTNAKTIAGLYGNDTVKWAGERISVYATTTSMGSETVECIRVRNKLPQQAPKQEEPSDQPS